MMKQLLAVALLFGAVQSRGQVVQIGPVNSNYCADLKVKPNLHVQSSVRVKGKITDRTGDPFKNSSVELRRYLSETKQPPQRKVTTDAEGNFDLGTLPKGEYRLLASPTRAFKQAKEMCCKPDEQCLLDIVLEVNPTDQVDSQCPIK
jgi:Carboxypeptidase regulatory-like domain